MTTAYPGGIDDFAEASPTYMSDPDSTGRTHDSRHDDVESAVEAIEKELGVNPSGPNANVAERLTGIRRAGGETLINDPLVIEAKAGYAPLFVNRPGGGYVIIDYAGTGDNYVDAKNHYFRNAQSQNVFVINEAGYATNFGRVVPTHLWDETVGRRLFVWDTNNARWQMVYGDTGRRDVSALVEATVTVADPVNAPVTLRRVGNVVTMEMPGVTRTGDSLMFRLPSGFRPNRYVMQGVQGASPCSALVVAADVYCDFAIAGGYLAGTWETTDPWPASLPGNAIGSVPTASNLLPGDYSPDLDPEIPTGLDADTDTSGWTVTYPDGPTP